MYPRNSNSYSSLFGPGVQQLTSALPQLSSQIKAVPDFAKQLYGQYIKSPQGEMFPQATWKKNPEEQHKIWQDFFASAAFGATSSPVKAGPISSAANIFSQTGTLKPKTPKMYEAVNIESALNLAKDVPIKDIHGNKFVLPQGEALTPYRLKDNKVLLHNKGDWIVNQNQYQNIKGQSFKAEAKPFAPELQQTTETVKGNVDYANLLRQKQGIPAGEEIFNIDLPKYSSYTIPGGQNYREILIQSPTQKVHEGPPVVGDTVMWAGKPHIVVGDTHAGTGQYEIRSPSDNRVFSVSLDLYHENPLFTGYKSPHWDEPNVISHLRLNDRTLPNGQKVTFMEEVQSDWALKLRQEGKLREDSWKKATSFTVRRNPNGPGYLVTDENMRDWSATTNIYRAQETANRLNEKGIPAGSKPIGAPSNPLVQNWQELTLKRALKEAVDNGSDYLSWTTGEQQAARYNLSKQVESIDWGSDATGRSVIISPKNSYLRLKVVTDNSGKIVYSEQEGWKGKNITDVVGKGIGEKIIKNSKGKLTGEGLNIGGEWAKNLYDKQIPNVFKDITGQKPTVIDLGLPVSGEERAWFKENSNDIVKTSDLREGNFIYRLYADQSHDPGSYLITKNLGKGKFQAVSMGDLFRGQTIRPTQPGEYQRITIKDAEGQEFQYYKTDVKEFELPTKKNIITQQAIKITPEIKAMVMGQAPKLKRPSGEIPPWLNVPKSLGIPDVY